MIRSFAIENFCSFRHETTVSFVVGKTVPTTTAFRDSLQPEERLTTVLGVFGPNASGKTNLLKGFAFANYFILHSYSAPPNSDIPVDGFLPLGGDEPTRLTMEYETDGTLFRYKVELTAKGVLSETLSRRGDSGRFSAVLQRQQADDDSKHSIVVKEPLDIPSNILRNTLRPNASIISTALQTGDPMLKKWTDCLGATMNVHRFGRVSHQSEAQHLEYATQVFFLERELFAEARRQLENADLGIKDVAIVEKSVLDEEKGNDRKQLTTEVTHSAGDLPDFTLPLLLESSGTKRLYILLSWLLPALKNGTPAIIDELESDMHPHMIPWVLRLFTSPILNPNNAQLFFTCHSVEMLNELDKTQIYLVGKCSEDNVSVATRLSDIEGVRRDDNIFNKYNSGLYGAVPEPV